jgi:hypothetical protein
LWYNIVVYTNEHVKIAKRPLINPHLRRTRKG